MYFFYKQLHNGSDSQGGYYEHLNEEEKRLQRELERKEQDIKEDIEDLYNDEHEKEEILHELDEVRKEKEHQGHGGDEHHEKLVSVTVEKVTKEIRPGEYTVKQIKKLFGVPEADSLAEYKDEKMGDLLSDETPICITGGEVFLISAGGGIHS